jgi:peptide-methionine (S)-S-oxide reductase
MKLAGLLVVAAAAVSGPAHSRAAHRNRRTRRRLLLGMESVFEHVKGVTDVVSGFAGGAGCRRELRQGQLRRHRPCRGGAHHLRSGAVSYAQLLQVYFAVAHDPTQIDRQGPDVGPSYRSAIFPQNGSQAAQARSFINKLTAGHVFKKPIATKIESGGFYPAEAYHQDYARKHPWEPYIVFNDSRRSPR